MCIASVWTHHQIPHIMVPWVRQVFMIFVLSYFASSSNLQMCWHLCILMWFMFQITILMRIGWDYKMQYVSDCRVWYIFVIFKRVCSCTICINNVHDVYISTSAIMVNSIFIVMYHWMTGVCGCVFCLSYYVHSKLLDVSAHRSELYWNCHAMWLESYFCLSNWIGQFTEEVTENIVVGTVIVVGIFYSFAL